MSSRGAWLLHSGAWMAPVIAVRRRKDRIDMVMM